MTTPKTIDEILDTFVSNQFFEIFNTDEPMYEKDRAEAKQALLAWVNEEIIGPDFTEKDYEDVENKYIPMIALLETAKMSELDEFRTQQRAKAKELLS